MPIFVMAWQWLGPSTWLDAMWEAVAEAAQYVWTVVWDQVVAWATPFLNTVYAALDWTSLKPSSETLAGVFAVADCVNLWVPLTSITAALTLYYGFVVVLLVYRLIKSWIPFVGG